MAGGAIVIGSLLLTIGGAVVLYSLVRAEQEQRETMDRASAEREARRDIRDRD